MKELLQSRLFNRTLYVLYVATIFVLISEFGFDIPRWLQPIILFFYAFIVSVSVLFTTLRYFFDKKKIVVKALIYDILTITFSVYCMYRQFQSGNPYVLDWIRYAVVLKLVREFLTPRFDYKRFFLNPAQLFIFSFFIIILVGSLLLMLPNATYTGSLSFVDALFTSTSAVCVTGLVVVDTGTFFTHFGHTIIITLIQIGGIGILTFVSYFSYFFKGGATYESQLALGDISNSGKIGGVFTTLKRILAITFFIEMIGAFIIYFTLSTKLIPSYYDRVYFSIFHSISSFCNAGFSTVPNGLLNPNYVSNYPLLLIISFLIIFGGLGFPIVINLLSFLKKFVKRRLLWFIYGKDIYKPWVLSLSSKISLVMTVSLLVFGTVVIYFNEYNNVLAAHDGIGKLVTAFFTATTTRTAGYNSIYFGQLHFSTTLIVIFLMWIGANAASTGGGIKTSTFAVALLNSFSLAKSKSRIEIWGREISNITVQRAFSKMTLSLLTIGVAIFIITSADRQFSLLDVAFECFSAFSTVGLSTGITGDLSNVSKIVLIFTMFIGRVSMLSILVSFFKRAKSFSYRYPTDEILIN